MERKGRKRKRRAINSENKLVVTFDPDARREFLTGFHKRKMQRRQEAADEIDRMQREERLSARKKKREQVKEKVDRLFEVMEKEGPVDKAVTTFQSQQQQLMSVTTVQYGFGDEDAAQGGNGDDDKGDTLAGPAATVPAKPKYSEVDSQPAPKAKAPLKPKKKKRRKKPREKKDAGKKGGKKGKGRNQ